VTNLIIFILKNGEKLPIKNDKKISLIFSFYEKKNSPLKEKNKKKSTASEAVFKNTKDLLNIISICNKRYLKRSDFPISLQK
jgi:hypothetical protein